MKIMYFLFVDCIIWITKRSYWYPSCLNCLFVSSICIYDGIVSFVYKIGCWQSYTFVKFFKYLHCFVLNLFSSNKIILPFCYLYLPLHFVINEEIIGIFTKITRVFIKFPIQFHAIFETLILIYCSKIKFIQKRSH